jgi:hypothetical protein
MPALEEQVPEPPSGFARVYFTTDEPARVDRVVAAVTSGTGNQRSTQDAPGLLCASTPCAVTLPYGDHDVAFRSNTDDTRTGRAIVRVRRTTEVVNHNLGRVTRTGVTEMGSVFVGLGILATGVGLGLAGSDIRFDASGRQAVIGLMLGGVGSMALGGLFFAASPITHQEGATTRWSPTPGGTAAGRSGPSIVGGAASVGVAF